MSDQPSQAAVRRMIIEFLDTTASTPDYSGGPGCCGMHHRTAMVLATCHDSQPRATVLEFFHEGLTLWALGVPGGKIANLRRNGRVSAVIYEQPMDHTLVQHSLQLLGTAELITIRNRPRLFRSRLKRWNMEVVMTRLLEPLAAGKGLAGADAAAFIRAQIDACSFIRIDPRRIIFKEYRPDFTMHSYVLDVRPKS